MKLKKKIVSIATAITVAGALGISAYAANDAVMKKAERSNSAETYTFDFSKCTSGDYTCFTETQTKSSGTGYAYITAEHGSFGTNMPVEFYVEDFYGNVVTNTQTATGVCSFSLRYKSPQIFGPLRLYGTTYGTYAKNTLVSGTWRAD